MFLGRKSGECATTYCASLMTIDVCNSSDDEKGPSANACTSQLQLGTIHPDTANCISLFLFTNVNRDTNYEHGEEDEDDDVSPHYARDRKRVIYSVSKAVRL